MPRTMVITGAKDLPGLPSDNEGGEPTELVDVHMFNHFGAANKVETLC